jgi:hypothetical protein
MTNPIETGKDFVEASTKITSTLNEIITTKQMKKLSELENHVPRKRLKDDRSPREILMDKINIV